MDNHGVTNQRKIRTLFGEDSSPPLFDISTSHCLLTIIWNLFFLYDATRQNDFGNLIHHWKIEYTKQSRSFFPCWLLVGLTRYFSHFSSIRIKRKYALQIRHWILPLDPAKVRILTIYYIMNPLIEKSLFWYYLIHIPITIFIDSSCIIPQQYQLAITSKIVDFHVSTNHDILLSSPQTWFKIFVTFEVVFQLPLFSISYTNIYLIV